MKKSRLLTSVSLLLTLCPLAARADVDPEAVTAMHGLTGVFILVSHLDGNAAKIGLDMSVIQTDIELKLRRSGVQVLTENTAPGKPYLNVNVAVTSDGTVAGISATLRQNMFMERDPHSWVVGCITWEATGIMAHPNAGRVRDYIKDLVDEFLNTWLAANPKPR